MVAPEVGSITVEIPVASGTGGTSGLAGFSAGSLVGTPVGNSGSSAGLQFLTGDNPEVLGIQSLATAIGNFLSEVTGLSLEFIQARSILKGLSVEIATSSRIGGQGTLTEFSVGVPVGDVLPGSQGPPSSYFLAFGDLPELLGASSSETYFLFVLPIQVSPDLGFVSFDDHWNSGKNPLLLTLRVKEDGFVVTDEATQDPFFNDNFKGLNNFSFKIGSPVVHYKFTGTILNKLVANKQKHFWRDTGDSANIQAFILILDPNDPLVSGS